MKVPDDDLQQMKNHEEILRRLARDLTKDNPGLVLKGGTALRLCYNLDRYSEDLDFDAGAPLRIGNKIRHAFRMYGGVELSHIDVLKDTDTTRRIRVVYHDRASSREERILVEESLRNPENVQNAVVVDGIRTYPFETLAAIKLDLVANNRRTKARDLHDLAWVLSENPGIARNLLNSVEVIGMLNPMILMERYAVSYQEDPFIAMSSSENPLELIIEDLRKMEVVLSLRTRELEQPGPERRELPKQNPTERSKGRSR